MSAETAITSRTWDCIKETQRALVDGDWQITEVWHVAPHRGRTQDFCPIRCSDDEGIVLPGYVERTVPTCPDCIVIVGAENGSERAS